MATRSELVSIQFKSKLFILFSHGASAMSMLVLQRNEGTGAVARAGVVGPGQGPRGQGRAI